ncbi:hypothetical protein LOTGIDRAFT_160342 [Lottia gigantea]|uniref:Uncharacterized protein n=1 Tax=Lottia gigantea TaxID=225164 RepID=V4AM06_LOTGI|nr:hypothetical protein LOTGIDRAFT_160342 [Lottia gigantea]ESO95795.1 hypothetical protein LOTGIDRAFT_160342 [Lottia gigantea]
MEVGSLKRIQTQIDMNRKFLFVANYLIKTKQESYVGYVDRRIKENEVKFDKDECILRESIIKQKSLMQCLHEKKSEGKCNFGKYNGASLDDLARRVEAKILENKPRIRRQRTMESLIKAGLCDGRIISEKEAQKRVKQFVSK